MAFVGMHQRSARQPLEGSLRWGPLACKHALKDSAGRQPGFQDTCETGVCEAQVQATCDLLLVSWACGAMATTHWHAGSCSGLQVRWLRVTYVCLCLVTSTLQEYCTLVLIIMKALPRMSETDACERRRLCQVAKNQTYGATG